MRFPGTRWCVVTCICALAACSRDQPFAPGLYSITGHLRLTGFFVDDNGAHAGTRVLGDADGVAVELLRGSEVVGRTTTVGGVYRFSGLRPGGYVARSRVIGSIGDQTSPLVIAVSDISSADTLRLVSRGDLLPVPNPFADTTQVYFNVPDTTRVDVRILDTAGHDVQSLLALEVLPANHAVFWNGRDQAGHPVAAGLYWVTYVAGHDVRAHLLFKAGTSSHGARSSRQFTDVEVGPSPRP